MNESLFKKLDAALVWLRDFVIVFFVIVISVYLAYRFWTTRDITWRWEEQVQLADGSILWVRRVEVREVKGGGEPFQGPLRGTKITRIHIPNGQDEVVWEGVLAPMIVERGIHPLRWTVIASPVWCKEHYQFGSPKPPYIQFDYSNGQWTHKHVDSAWYGRRANLLISEEQQAAHDGKSVSAEEIQKFNKPVYKVFERFLFVNPVMKSNCYR